MTAPTPKPRHRVVAALIEVEDRYLLTQRRPEASLPLLWEFPGGRVEPGETDEAALERELQERIGVNVQVGALHLKVSHPYPAWDVDLLVFQCTLAPGAQPRAIRCHQVRWVPHDDLHNYQFPPADQDSMRQLLAGD